MPWVYLDDHWDEHPKILDIYELDPLAPLLFISGNTYCRRNATEGRIPGTKIKGLLGYRPKAHRALLAAGLWNKVGPGEAVEIHDWDQWNKAGEARSASARNAARIKWDRERERTSLNDA